MRTLQDNAPRKVAIYGDLAKYRTGLMTSFMATWPNIAPG
jgi:hypothetical protein